MTLAHATFPQIFSDRTGRSVIIRQAVENDAEALIAHVTAADLESSFLSREPGEFKKTVIEERMFIKQISRRANSLLLVALDADGSLLGSIDFHGGGVARLRHVGEFGVSVRQAAWGRGVGGRLLDSLIAWARLGAVIRKIRLRVHTENHQAIALYRRRGFIDEGVMKRELWVEGAWADVLMMALWLD